MALRATLLLSAVLQPGAAAVLSAQESAPSRSVASRQQVAASFVSKLQAAAEGLQILLSWRNPQDLDSARLVYRSTEPISEATFASAELIARLEPDAVRYVDTPPDQGGYFYAVLLEGGDGRLHKLFIPLRNVTSSEVRVTLVTPQEEVLGGVAAEESGLAPRGVATAQESAPSASEESRQQVSAPFVSKLQAAAEGSQILLTWRNPKDLEGNKLVYRSTEPISDATFGAAELIARLQPDAVRYIDTPRDLRGYFYAILLEGGDGRLYKLFIPFRNVTSREVQVAVVAPEEELAAEISGITATAADDTVEIRFRASRNNRELLLFRSESPIRVGGDLLNAAPPVGLDPGATGYVDYPIPGIAYYYCVLDAELFRIGQARPVPGGNSTASPVQIPIGGERVGLPSRGTSRPLPLPLLLIQSAVQSGEALAAPAPFRLPAPKGNLRPETRAAITRILVTAPPLSAPPRELEILSEDRQSPEDLVEGAAPGSEERLEGRTPAERSESRILSDIINGETAWSNPAAAALSLQDFLRIRRTAAVEDRAHFYLGQMYYQTGRPREAMLEFILARDTYYPQSEAWLSACFLALWREN